jgi:hypothetical protein
MRTPKPSLKSGSPVPVVPLESGCVECPASGTETCEVLAQLGTYCDVAACEPVVWDRPAEDEGITVRMRPVSR